MVETAAHLTDHVFPRLPVRQWVLAVPKRLRYFLHRDAGSACERTVRAPVPRRASGRWRSSTASAPRSIRTCIFTA